MSVSNLDFKPAVTVASTANVAGTFAFPNSGPGDTLTAPAVGALVIDGHTVVANDRVLLKNQSAALQNGIYCLSQANVAGIIATTGAIVQPSSGTIPTGTFQGVALTGGSGSGAQATVTTAGGVVTGVFVTNPGSGYQVGDVVTYNANGQGFGNGGTVVVATIRQLNAAGGILTLSGFTQPTGGTLVAGTYTGTPLTGGAGSGAVATVVVGSGAPVINLASSVTYGVIASSTITNTGSTNITGNLALSPAGSITGSPTVSGTINNGNAAAATALSDANSAFTAGNALVGFTTIAAQLGGTSPVPGYYTTGSSFQITGTLTLNGGPNSVWVFKSPSSTLITAAASSVVLTGGALPQNVYWLVGSSATLGTTSTFVGTIIAEASITDNGGSSVNGHMFALTAAVTLNNTTVVATPAGSGTLSVTSVTVTTPGTAYVATNVLGYTGAGLGTGGTATVGTVAGVTGSILTTSTLVQPSTDFVTNGYYFGFPLTGGTGTGATANITVVGGVVTSVVIANPGTGYTATDVLGFTGSGPSVGLGVGGTIALATVSFTPWVLERSPDANFAFQVAPMSVWVLGGTANINTAWTQNTLSVVLDTTALTFVELVA